MSITINNPAGFSVYSNYASSSYKLEASMSRMASGEKGVAEDGAGVAISERMRSQARSTAMARQNTEGALAMLRSADSWLQRVNDVLARMHELAVEANDGTKTNEDRQNIASEFEQLQEEIARITDGNGTPGKAAAKYNTQMLFDGTFSVAKDVQVGADAGQTITVQLKNLSGSSAASISATQNWSVVLDGALVSVAAGGASAALSSLTDAIAFVANERALIGGQQSRFEHTRTSLLTYEDNIRAAESKVRDVDMAKESSTMAKYQILGQVGNAMLAQANQLPAAVMQLIG